jgi:dUTP pyrophosphatase
MKRAEMDSTTHPLYVTLSPGAVAPVRGSAAAAGYDLSASETTVIPARGRALVPTGVSIALPPSTLVAQ